MPQSNQNAVARFTEKWRALERLYEGYAKANGLTYMSFTVLEIIFNHPSCCTQKLICEQSLYTKQSVNAIIKAFWQQGYLELKEEPADRRNKTIQLTEKGQAYASKVIGRIILVEQQAMEQFSDAQWETVIQVAALFERHFSAGVERLIRDKG